LGFPPDQARELLDVVLWLGQAKISARGVIATRTAQVGNGIQFLEMTLRIETS
jgi:hypothetical protein